jgi:hypothetical protein
MVFLMEASVWDGFLTAASAFVMEALAGDGFVDGGVGWGQVF